MIRSSPVITRNRVAALVALTAISVFGRSATAADFLWNVNVTSGNMNTPGNWAGGVVPPLADPTTNFTFLGLGGAGVTATTITNDIGLDLNTNLMTFQSGLSGGLTLAGSSFLFNGATPSIRQGGLGNVTISAPLNLGGDTVVGGANIQGLGNITITGIIGMGANRLIVGNGATGNAPTAATRVIALNGQNTSSAGGGVTLDGGNLSIGGTLAANSGLGTAFIVGPNGGTLQTSGAITSLSATSFVINGPLDYIGTNQLQLGAATIISGSGPLNVRNSSATALVVQSASNGYTGAVTLDRSLLPAVSAATGTMTLNGAGTMTGVTNWTAATGSTLTATSNVGAAVNDRLGNSAAINLRHGNLTIGGSVTAATAVNEDVGVITGQGGLNAITAIPNGTGLAFTQLLADSLARQNQATFNFRGTALGTLSTGNAGNITFGAAPAGQIGTVPAGAVGTTTNLQIIPYATADTSGTGNGAAFAVYGDLGVRLLATAETVATFTGTDNNVRIAAATPNNATVTVNSLWVAVASATAVSGTGTVNVTSGGVLFTSAATVSNTLAFGSQEGIVHAAAAGVLSGPLTGSGGFTKSGAAGLTLSGDNSGLTGTLAINRGLISFGALNSLPGTGDIIVNGALGSTTAGTGTGLTFTGATGANLARNINIQSGWATIVPAATGVLELSGTLSGNGSLFVGSSNTGTLRLSGTNAGFTGTIRMNEGTLEIASDANLGSGTGIDFFTGNAAGGSEGIRLTGNWTTSKNINFTSASEAINTQANNAVWNGPVTGTGGFVKQGSGSLTINAPGNVTGTVAATGGSVVLANNGALQAATYTLGAGTTLVLDNTALPASTATYGTPARTFVERVADTSAINLTGATLRSVGNSTGDIAERLGTVTANGGGNTIQVEIAGVGLANELHIGNLATTAGSVLVRGTGIGAPTGDVARVFLTQFNGASVTDNQLLANVTVEDLNNLGAIDSGIYSLTRGIRVVDVNTDFVNGMAIQNGPTTNLPTTANFRVNPAVANPVPVLDAANTINALRFAPNGVVDYNAATPGTLTITSGIIFTEAGGAASITQSGAGVLTLTAGAATLSFATNANLTVNAALGGTGGVSKAGAGTLTLNGAYGTTGALAIGEGTLALGTGVNLSTGVLTGAAGTTISLGANSLTVAGATASNHAGTLTGTGGLTYAPTASTTLTLSGANSGFSGPVTLDATGTLNASLTLGNAAALGTGPLAINDAAPTITFNSGSATFTNAITLSAPAAAAITVFTNGANSNQTTTLNGPISGGNANTTFRVTGPGDDTSVFVLGNAGNTFRGTISVFEGQLAVASDGALGDLANTIALNSTTVSPAIGGLRFDGSFTSARGINFIDANALNTNGNAVTLSGVVSGGGALNKVGAGTLTLSNGANTHTGALNVDAGRLNVTGLIADGTAVVTVNTGGTLGGTGTINRPITVASGGTLAPGTSIGTLTVATNRTTTLAGGSIFEFEYNASATTPVAGVDNDLMNGALATLNLGGLTGGNRLNVNLVATNLPGFDPTTPVTYTAITYAAGTPPTGIIGTDLTPFVNFTGQFAGVPMASFTGGTVMFSFVPVPEPLHILAVSAVGAAGLGWIRKRRAAKKN